MRKQSKKLSKENRQYLAERALYLTVHKLCKVCGTRGATEIHHKAGREGYWDEDARAAGRTLRVDNRNFLPVCRDCHERIERNPNWAKERGFSLNRTNR